MPVGLEVRTFEQLERLVGAADLVVPRTVVAELDRLAADGSGTAARAASVGRSLAADRCREIGDAAGSADASIVGLAAASVVDYVVTNDAALRHRVLDTGIPVISLRGRTQMEIIHP